MSLSYLSDKDYFFHSLLSVSDFEKSISSSDTLICYDAFEILKVTGSFFLYDIKVLYELLGYKFDTLSELCNQVFGENSTLKFSQLQEKIRSHLRSYSICRVNFNELPQEKILPISLVELFYEEKCKLLNKLFLYLKDEDIKKFYRDFFSRMQMLYKISSTPLHFNLESIKDNSDHYSSTIKSLVKEDIYHLRFHPVGAKTGRLSFDKSSLNIYTLPKELRSCIVAPQDYSIVQFDFKAFQPRLAIFSTKDELFKNKFKNIKDIYSLFPGERDKIKVAFLAWMYSVQRNEVFEEVANPVFKLREELYKKSISGKVINPFGRCLFFEKDAKNVVFQNYITSLEIDCMLRIIGKIYHRLSNYKSKIIFPFHDAVVLYIHESEMFLVEEIKKMMESFFLKSFDTLFPVDVKIGKNFLDMESYCG
jgi:hypothetical protein